MAFLEVRDLRKQYGRKEALRGVTFAVEEGELFCLLGAPGAGKTTIFRVIAGLDRPDDGDILIEGSSVLGVAPQHRDVAMVFEDMALYPHMTAFGNMAHALYLRKLPEGEIRERVGAVADLLRIQHLMDRHPETYSGGERRRVAVARALVRRPRILLLDQALSGLDAKIRQDMTGELKRLQRETGQTMVYATHDFEEGAAMADRCLVMRAGAGLQLADPQTLYASPEAATVGRIIGTPAMNLIRCRAEPRGSGTTRFGHPDFQLELPIAVEEGAVLLGVRPEHLAVAEDRGDLRATVDVVQMRGPEKIVDLRVGEELTLKAVVPPEQQLEMGESVSIGVPPELVFVFEAESERRVHPPV
ncbi:MAG TPA: ABC transporter ATP-binding protein [Actinomycetota bacterium]|jgi:multiple sugar transport system ATP-binding protein|nr:ABC transporter ATP-binding protein [Actinomycetota bacterium]